MKLLFVSPRQCWPTVSGAKLREYHFLRALSREAEVDYVYFRDSNSHPLSKSELSDCRNIVPVSKPDAYTIRHKILGIVGEWPLPILNYTSQSMTDAVKKLVATNRYDLIHLDSIHLVRCTEGLKTPVIYDWHNIESEAMGRYADTVDSRAKSFYARATAKKMHRLERRILLRDFGHVVCSERERLLLLSIEPRARIATVENGVDTSFFAVARKALPGGFKTLVFVGTMDYYPNVDAVVSFATKIWPSIRSRMSDARFTIVGANPTLAVQKLSQIPGVTVTGTVPDVRPYYESALAAIAPIRSGGGTRLKILEAMAAGVPVISTPLGAEGVDAVANTHILIANPGDATSWLDCVIRLSEAEQFAASLSANASALIKSRYEWEFLGRKLRRIYQQWLTPSAVS